MSQSCKQLLSPGHERCHGRVVSGLSLCHGRATAEVVHESGLPGKVGARRVNVCREAHPHAALSTPGDPLALLTWKDH